MQAAYRDFKKQHPQPNPVTPPYAPACSKHDPVPPVAAPVPPLTLLLAPNKAKPTQTTVIHHGAKWHIPKHHMTARDLPKVPHDSQSMPRTCSACDPEAPTTPWPVLHLKARHHTRATTHLPPQAYAWVAPWFNHTDANPTVAWNPDHTPEWLFNTTATSPRADPAGVAIGYSMYEPGRTSKDEDPYYPLHHTCHTPEKRTQTLTCRDLNPVTAYILHYIYSYLTQGQPEQGLKAMSPPAKHIISKGIGVYATPILQPTTPVAHLTTGLAIYAYLPMTPCRLPQPSPADLLFFTDTSGESALTPITGGATLQLTDTGGHYHMDHHTGHTTYGASSHGELGAMADAIAEITTHLPVHLPHVVRVWFVVDATVHTHLLPRIARQPLHIATATSLGIQALLLWKALRSLPPYVQLQIVKQESRRHQFRNGKVDNQAVHQRTTHLPNLQDPDLGQKHTHLQHIPPEPEPHRTPDCVPEDAPYTSHDRSYHYPSPIQHLTRVLGDTDSGAHIQELQEKLTVPLYHSALRPANVPAHLQKRRIQLLREQLPYLTRVMRWLARKHINVPEEDTRCPCDHATPEDWEHFKICPLHTGRDTLVGWSLAETLQQHEGWPFHSHAHQATEHLFRDPLVKEATMRGALTQALHRHLAKHTENPMEAAVHIQLKAVRRAAAQMVHRKHLLLTHTEQLTDPTASEHMQRLIHYHWCMTQKSTNPLRAPRTPPPSPSAGLQDTTRAPRKASRPHRTASPPQATTAPQSPPLTHEAIGQRQAQPSPPRATHTSTWTRRTPAAHPASPPPGPGAPPPHTDHHPRPRLPPGNPPRQGPEHSPALVAPTGELDQAHRQSPPGPDHPRQRPPRGRRRRRTLASRPTRPRPARLDPPYGVGAGPDTRHRHQRHAQRDHTPTTSPRRERPPSRPDPPEQW